MKSDKTGSKERNNTIPYDYRVICDVCGKKLYRSQAKKRWDKLIVCQDDFEFRHVNDFPPPIPKYEGQGVIDARPPQPSIYVPYEVSSDAFNTNKQWGIGFNLDPNFLSNWGWGGIGDPNKWGNT